MGRVKPLQRPCSSVGVVPRRVFMGFFTLAGADTLLLIKYVIKTKTILSYTQINGGGKLVESVSFGLESLLI